MTSRSEDSAPAADVVGAFVFVSVRPTQVNEAASQAELAKVEAAAAGHRADRARSGRQAVERGVASDGS